MEEFSFTPDAVQNNVTPNDVSEFSFIPDEVQPDLTKVGAHNIFSLDGSNTNAAKKLNLVNRSWVEKFAQSDFGKFGDTQSKAVVRGLFDIAAGLGTMIRFYGDNMILPKGAFGLDDKTIDRINTFGRGWQKFGSSIKKGSDFVLNSKTLELDKDIFAGDIIDNPSVTRVSSAIMSAAPSLLGMVGIARATGSAGLAYFVMGGVDSADVYEKAKETGKTQETANLLYTSSQAGTALIDRMLSPLEKIMGNSPSTIWKKISQKIASGLAEGSAEGAQTVWQNAVTKYGIDDTQALMDGVIEAAIGGFGSGALAAGTFNTAAERLKEKGMTDRDIENISQAAIDYVQKHPDEINDIAFQQLNKGLDEFEKFVESHKGTPEAQKALQTKADLEQVYTDVSERLKKVGVSENVANADAKIWQGIALWGSQESGLSPLEYMKQRMPKVERTTYEQFKNKGKTLEEKLDDYIPYQLPAEAYNKQGKADVNSEAFKRWFGDSKVVDESGRPLKMVHFSGNEFSQFDKNRTGINNDESAVGFWFADRDDFAFNNEYHPVRYDVYLKMDNPLIIEGKGTETNPWADTDIDNLDPYTKFEKMFNDLMYQDPQMWDERVSESLYGGFETQKIKLHFANLSEERKREVIKSIVDKLKTQGYDGIIIKNTQFDSVNPDEKINQYVVFEPNQIKSVYNRGTFDPNNDNIYYQSDKNKNIVKITGKEFGGYTDSNDLRRKAYKYFQDNLQGQYVQHPTLGKIKFIRRGIDKLKSTSADIDKLKLVPKIKEIIETSQFLRSETPKKPHGNIVKFHYLSNNVNLEGKNIDVFISIAEDNEGNFFYNINKDKNQPSQDDAVQMRSGEGLADKSAININITPTRENVNKTLYQTAFAGSRVDYDRPSLEAIGSGEGAQAHGWGLYYALNKDVAESYRKTFIGESMDTNLGLANYYLRKNEFDVDLAIDALQEDVYNGNVSEDTAKEIFEYFENIPQSELEQNARRKGQVHEVDLPENPYLLDEQKSYDEQSDFVKSVLDRISETYGIKVKGQVQAGVHFHDITGKFVYNKLAGKLGSSKAASEKLREYGIKGITYDGKQDGRCFVIFNPDDVKVIQKFYQQQEAEAPKGAYMQNLDRNGVIYLFENADASTFMHETAHFFRKELEGFDTARSREMLQKMSEWENQEFDKRYKLKEENGRYVVADKIGNVIYGAEKPFFDAETAREYARNEIFARGFEQYLREGKAPNNYLKQAFRSFWNWLRHLYKAAEELGVDINDSIRSVYGEIIGGKDLDFYLTAPVDEVLQQHFAENEERQKEYDRQIALAQAQPIKRGFFRNIAQERTDGAKGRNEWWNKAMVPISTRAKRVNIKFRNRLRQYDYVSNNKLNQYYAQIKPFLDKWAKMTETDAIAFDLALKNSYVEKQLEIVNKYDAYDEFVAVKNLLNNLFDQAMDVGVEMGYSADYFPRQIDDVEGFMSAMYGSPYASQLRRALKEADPDNVMTNEERAEFFNKYLRGFNRRDLNKPLPGNVKDRTIDIVTAEMNRYYKPSMQALINYIEGMNTSIESRKFWGFKSDDIDQSIGALTANMIDSGLIKPEQDAEVQAILKARFKARGVTNKWLNLQKNVSYIYMMGGINSAITQIDDISTSLYKAGLWNTVEAVFSRNRPGLSREELGLERIGQEFVEASTSSKAVSTVFKLTGLDKIDAFGKNTLINATFNKFQKMADNNEKELRARLEPVLEEETSQTIADIKNGVISENVKLLMFNELADMQPIALSEMPEWYLTGGNGRVFYMLKTFMLKRLDIFRNECFDKIRGGDTGEGVRNLFRLAVLMIMAGSAKDAIIDMLFGREFDFTDTAVNNLLGLAGISKYSLYKARDEGFSGFASSFIIPPVFASTSDLLSDIYKSLFSKKGKDISDYEIWKGLPLIGRFYYWWLGGGRTKLEKKNKKKLK